MALNDPFDTTYQGAYKSGLSLGQGIESASGSIADAMNKQSQQKQFLKMIGMINDSGAAKTEQVPLTTDEYNKQAEDTIRTHADKVFGIKDVQLTGSSDPEERRKQYQAMLEPIGLSPQPKTINKIDTNKISNKYDIKMQMDSEGKPSYSFSSKTTDPMAEELRATRLQNMKEQGTQKEQAEQDKVEKEARQQFISVRGDSSIATIEKQRDAAIQGYTTLKDIRKEGRLPSSFELTDILAQTYRSRTGAAPTNEIMKDLFINTLGVQANKVEQYFSGKATPATTEDIANKVENFLNKSGMQLDKMHKKYMEPRLVKPSNLSDKKWEEISKNERGMSFEEAMSQYKNQGQDTNGNNNDPLGLRQ